jgi:hypothetical protein
LRLIIGLPEQRRQGRAREQEPTQQRQQDRRDRRELGG